MHYYLNNNVPIVENNNETFLYKYRYVFSNEKFTIVNYFFLFIYATFSLHINLTLEYRAIYFAAVKYVY